MNPNVRCDGAAYLAGDRIQRTRPCGWIGRRLRDHITGNILDLARPCPCCGGWVVPLEVVIA